MIVLETIGRRWYAFGFIAFFWWAARAAGGPRRALRFLAIAAGLSLAAELASTRSPFPYGRYAYVAGTRGDELYLWNVPLFVPISFGTVVWAGRSLAAAAFRLTSPAALIVGGALAAAVIDLVIDPMTLRGDEWFLGRLYAFQADGYFGVPWSNFGGWLLVSAAIIAVDLGFERSRVPPHPASAEARRGTILAFGIMGFFDVIALATANWAAAGAGSAITLALGVQVLATAASAAPAEAPSGDAPATGA